MKNRKFKIGENRFIFREGQQERSVQAEKIDEGEKVAAVAMDNYRDLVALLQSDAHKFLDLDGAGNFNLSRDDGDS